MYWLGVQGALVGPILVTLLYIVWELYELYHNWDEGLRNAHAGGDPEETHIR